MGICLETYGDPTGVGVSYERGTPVILCRKYQPQGRQETRTEPEPELNPLVHTSLSLSPPLLFFLSLSLFEPVFDEREFVSDILLMIMWIQIVMIRWTGLAPWEFEFPFPGSFISTFLGNIQLMIPTADLEAPV